MTFAEASPAWAVLGIVLGAVLISEAITYLTVYRRPTYVRACKSVKELTKKFEKEESKLVPADKRKNHDRNLARVEEEVKDATNRMNAYKLIPSIVSAIAFFFLYRAVASKYTGIVVAKLPFVPFSFIQGFMHRGLEGQDMQACGFGFIYTLATMALKTNVPKLLGFAPPRSAFDAQKAASRAIAKADAETS